MNPYQRYVLPKMIDIACGMSSVMALRAKIIPQATGEVLEIGIGSGLNLPFYNPDTVSAIVGVDPAAQMQKLARTRANDIAIPVEIIAVDVQGIHAATDRFDTIVMTFTLCSIADPIAALQEMARVLKPKGQLLFCEHGLAPDLTVERWQHRLTPLWKPLTGGCHLDRNIPELLAAGGFEVVALSEAYLSGPRALTYIYSGQAHPST
ncbi:MAG: methyltransferase domain-containing protein [Psychrobacter sp.]|nr:methyltransferase domain-containing protein [Psychrobacter sp.]